MIPFREGLQKAIRGDLLGPLNLTDPFEARGSVISLYPLNLTNG